VAFADEGRPAALIATGTMPDSIHVAITNVGGLIGSDDAATATGWLSNHIVNFPARQRPFVES
jgi:hypothetical protein